MAVIEREDRGYADADQASAILNAVLKDLLTNPALKSLHTKMGTLGLTRVQLVRKTFPPGYSPAFPSFGFSDFDRDSWAAGEKPATLIIMVETFEVPPRSHPPGENLFYARDDAKVVVNLRNGALEPAKKGSLLRAYSLYYKVERKDNAWGVACMGAIDA
ncbi:MAG: hypothetical protein HY721_28750 [Planctomycetes bacterium]|nr:hypothetical protein [Planctomycetota bacterium]